jgi:hypothetical protein
MHDFSAHEREELLKELTYTIDDLDNASKQTDAAADEALKSAEDLMRRLDLAAG